MDTNSIFKLHQVTRNNLLNYLELPTEKLVKIPAGFNNNILWNIAHCVATQQILCYLFSENTPLVSQEFINTFKKGTSPTQHSVSENFIAELKQLLKHTQQQLEKDYTEGKFTHFTPYETSYGFTLNTIEDAISFNNTHEAMHLGTIKAISYFI